MYKEKVKAKCEKISKCKINGYELGEYKIEIIGKIKVIEKNGMDGIEVFAKAWKENKQIGFGKNGIVEIERFRFYNPPILIKDLEGDIIIERHNPKTGNLEPKKYKKDYETTFKSYLVRAISIKGKDGKNIVKGKVGNTVSTFFAGGGDGRIEDRSSTSWDVVHDKSTATYTAHYDRSIEAKSSKRSDGNFAIARGFFPFDTSALGVSEVINSAILSLYITNVIDQDNDGDDFLGIVQTTQVSNTTLSLSDYSKCGDINNPTEGANRIDLGDITTAQYTDFTLTETGRGWISKTGFTKLGIREGHDILDNPFVGGNNTNNYVNISGSETVGTLEDPTLTIDHTTLAAGKSFAQII